MITLTLKDAPPVPLEAETLTPDTIAPLTIDAIRALPVNLGKHRRRLDDFFTVEGTAGDEIEIHGDAGMHLGSQMRGGAIDVHGNAGDWLGAEMSGGFIHQRPLLSDSAGPA